jgi:hypothetical protein
VFLINRSTLAGFVFLFILSACGGGGGDDSSGDGGTVITDVTTFNASSSSLGRVILPGVECPTGGVQIDSGIDDNGNGVLDPAEVDTSEVICNGAVGGDGLTSLVEQTEISAGIVCAAGGVRFDVGKDQNSNDALDAFEITSSEFLCTDGLFGSGGAGAPVIVSAISISNTEVVVQFSEPMLPANAENPINYDINSENQQTTLPVWDAAFYNPDNSTVLLSTFSQSSVGYVLVVSNMRDLDGNPIADPTILIDPSRTTFSGTEPSGATVADSDGDTLPDHVELIGWDVTITYGNDTTETRRVTSDPGNPTLAVDDPVNVAARDTDGEGVTDNEERHGDMDPRQPDTDGDTLTDNQEWNNIYSDPTNQDTDGDGTQDGFEFYSYRTSPILADTDGDQINDTDEVLGRNRDPRIADIPRAGINIGEVRLLIDERYNYVDELGQTITSESNSTSTLSQSTNRTFSTSDTDVTEHVGKGGFKLAAKSEITGGYKYTDSNTFNTSQVSHSKSQEVHAASLSKAQQFNTISTVTREIFGASIDVDLTIRNSGDLAFAISNLEITVLQADRQSTGRFVPVATLIANSTLITGTPMTFNLGPFTPERGPILFSSRDVFPALVDQLMAAPGGLIFKVANFDMTDEFGRVFSFANQLARDRTAGIIIDFGDGDAQQHLVATALQPDPDDFIPPVNNPALYPPNDPRGWGFVGGFSADGSAKGIPLDFALQDTLGLTKNASPQLRIIAGANGIAESFAQADDIQLIANATGGLDANTVIIAAGPDGTLQSGPSGDDELFSEADGIVAGPDREAQSIAQGDDVQLVPPGTRGVGIGTVVVSAGQDGILDSSPFPGSDDSTEVTSGYETSLTCDDISPNAGDICSLNSQCGVGSCTGPEILVRFGGLRNGDLDRQWAVLSNQQLPAGADFGQITLMPGADVYLAFVQDLDGDGLFAREEYLLGSTDSRADIYDNDSYGKIEFTGAAYELLPLVSAPLGDGVKDSVDSDRDGLSDFAEARIGWQVAADGGLLRRVFSSPRLTDSDGDGLFDPQEQDLRTFCATQPGYTRDNGWCSFLSDPPVTQGEAVGIIAGLDGTADSAAQGDDIQLIPQGTAGLTYSTVVIGAGTDGIVSTPLAVDSFDPLVTLDDYASNASLSRIPPATDPGFQDTDFDGITDFDELVGFDAGRRIRDNFGGNNLADTVAVGDDVQFVPLGLPLGPLSLVILPGPNGVIDSTPGGDDLELTKFTSTTNPLRSDTDDDMVSDGRERALWSYATNEADGPAFRDSDLDGLSDATENFGWMVGGIPPRVPSNINMPDSDLDGLPDLIERDIGSNPSTADTDGDGLPDFDEFAAFDQYFGFEQRFPGFSVNGSASAQYGTDPTRVSTDTDGISDYDELITGYRILIAGEPTFREIFTNPLLLDTDLDGLWDSTERNFQHTDGTDPDTDGDGRTDFDEVVGGSNPLVPDMRVTVRYLQMKLNGGPGTYDLQWDLNVAHGGNFPGTNADNRNEQDWIAANTPITNVYSNLVAIDCAATPGRPYLRITGNLASINKLGEISFTLRAGQSFAINGRFAEWAACATATLGCDMSFFETFTFEGLSQGGVTNKIKPTNDLTSGTCNIDLAYSISID